MYTVSKGPSKFVAKTRIGMPSHLDSSWESKKTPDFSCHEDNTHIVSGVSKPVFLQLNNKKLHSLLRSQEILTPEHEEIVKFVSENWTEVTCKSKQSMSIENGCSTMYYQMNDANNNQLKDFVPFDLDSWWGKRLFNTITKSVP